MLDSANFIANGVSSIDTQRLCALGIRYHKLKYNINSNGTACVSYGNEKQEIDAELVSEGIGFTYRNISFMHLVSFSCVIIVANTHRVLGKKDILLSDRDRYINNVRYVVETVLNVDYSELDIHRIDYCVDLELDTDLIYEYLQLLDRHKTTYQHIKRINEYESSIYLTSKYGKKRINIYDKYRCEKDKYMERYAKAHKRNGISLAEYQEKYSPEYEQYKNIFRVEVQNTKKLIKDESNELWEKQDTTNPISAHKINKSLYGYWNTESMQTYYFDLLKDFLYTGSYYKPKEAIKLVKKSKAYTDSEKAELPSFINAVNKYGISGVTESKNKGKNKDKIESQIKNKDDHPKWCGATINTYSNYLQEIGIDIWLIDIHRNGDLKKELQLINKSKNSKNWKAKLRQYIRAVNKYGIVEVTANNNDEINTRYSRHKRWCSKSVENYIKMLETMGINPVTLDKNSKYRKLDSLYTLIEKVAKDKYFDIDTLDIPTPAPVKEPKLKPKPKPKAKPVAPTTPIANNTNHGSRRRNGNCNVW